MDGRSLYFTGRETVELRSRSVDPTREEVVVETRFSAISAGTELLVYRGEAPSDLPADETLDALDGDLSYPLRYGYAAVGDVAETGTAVDDDWLGRTVLAFNPHETRFTATPSALVPVPDDLTPTEMTLYPPVETATTLVMDGRPRIGERVVVFGAGVIGLCTVARLSSFPLSELVVVEPLADRRERALTLGADDAVTPDAFSPDRWNDAAGAAGADLVYELSGQPDALDAAVDAAGYDGRVVVGSWYGTKSDPEVRGRWTRERRSEVTLDGLATLPADVLITHRVPIEEAAKAYRLIDQRRDGALQVLFEYP
ncbi:oxidoreductase [Halobacteriales archaeon QS_9_67_17]|nr:MAG: oxidoreductase [Halobacteriales archaeon QS_9_67_17]